MSGENNEEPKQTIEPQDTTNTSSPVDQQPVQEPPRRTAPQNHIFIGKKPVMSYAMSAMIQLSHSDDIVLKARGMVISRAVDVAEVISKRLGKNTFVLKGISIDTESVGEGQDARNVSTIEISIGKQ